MIDDIVDYINSYDDVRALLGLNKQELPDATLALTLYASRLTITLQSVSGEYPSDHGSSRNLVELYDSLTEEDEMYIYISLLATYSVASHVLKSIGLRAYKTISDGKSTITRFSPESTYKDVTAAVNAGVSDYLGKINELLGSSSTDLELLRVVPPAVDLVEGE